MRLRSHPHEIGRSESSDRVHSLSATRKLLPRRYEVKEDDSGAYVTCVETPNIAIRIRRGLSMSGSAARKQRKHTVFLDGVVQDGPFMDTTHQIYNLDHHEGCVRAFTLATCEQAMVVILKGLDLTGENWQVFANEPDLDTVLAIWLFLNHRRIDDEEDRDVRDAVMPLVRLQGVIDAHGLELKELTGFPQDLQERMLEVIAGLRKQELELKQAGSWGEIDLHEFTLASLGEIDHLVYSPRDFENQRKVDELERVSLGGDRIALICRSELGIYEVEQHLKEEYGDRLGLVILQKGEEVYTIRQAHAFLRADLGRLYERLNSLDPRVRPGSRWGGSGDIGGSPRATGTALSVADIAAVCRWVYRPPTLRRRLRTATLGVALGLAVPLLAVASTVRLPWPPGILDSAPWGAVLQIVGVLGLAAAGTVALLSGRAVGHLGLRSPRGLAWLVLLLPALLLAGAGGVWIRPSPGVAVLPAASAGIGLAVALELLYRGALLRLLLLDFQGMSPGGRWFLSVPTALSGGCFGIVVGFAAGAPPWLAGAPVGIAGTLLTLGSAAALGLVLGAARERSASLWAPMVLHVAGLLAALLVPLIV